MGISAVISAYNEEKNIKECLTSLEGLVDEIIVVDNSSTDKTSEIARKFTKKIFKQENNPTKIDLQKNFGFSKASEDYILTIDADERLTPELINEIKENISQEVDGFWIPRKNYIFGKWIKSDMWWPDYQLKLFKKGKAKFSQNDVHKALIVNGSTAKLENPIIHNNYTSVSQFVTKLNNYTDIEAISLRDSGYKFSWLDSIRFPTNDFLKTFFLQKGYREGLHGLVLSILQAFYMEIVFAKLWESKGFEEVNDKNFVKNLKKELSEFSNKFKYWGVTILINDSKNPLKKVIFKAARKIVSTKIN